MAFRQCGIVGLGLLGGSLAFDLRAAFPELEIVGVARRKDTLLAAAELRVGDALVFTELSRELSALGNADLIFICTPVQTIIQQLALLAHVAAPGTVITDVGSTKRMIMNAAVAALPANIRFIGGHPMAGREQGGLGAAVPNLYRHATWALCVPAGAEVAAEQLAEVITAIGAQPRQIDACTHDEIVALTSHLPHVTAAALVNVVLGGNLGEETRQFIAGGFRDTTRVATGVPEMWRDIILTNRDQILPAIDALINELGNWRDAVRNGDAPYLEALLATAAQRRGAL